MQLVARSHRGRCEENFLREKIFLGTTGNEMSEMKTKTPLRLVLAAATLALCASASAQMFTGSVTVSDPTENGRLFRDGVPSMSGMNKTFPGVFNAGTPYHYDSYIFTNPFAVTTAFTINMSTTSTTNLPFGVVYLGTFDPTNIATNYRADGGLSPTVGLPQIFSFDIPAGASFTVIMNETTAGGAAAGNPAPYTFTLSPAAVPEPSTVLELSVGAALLGMWAWRRHSRVRSCS
ncbi:MAG: PEP-CTERM sorting domain-containing protein [Chthoniobacterales bacterium]